METALSVLVGLFFAAAIYLMLSKHIIRILLGIALFGNAVNLLIFTAGRVAQRPLRRSFRQALAVAPGPTANPLPQALILTAIVISFSFFAFLLVLAYRAYQDLGTDDTDGMRLAEPDDRQPAADGVLSDGGDRSGHGRPRRGNRHDAGRACRLAGHRAGGSADR